MPYSDSPASHSELPSISYHAIDEALIALREGRLIIVVDDQDRENEGDFVCAAEKITPEIVGIMLRRGMGTLCVPMSRERAEQLQLAPLVERNTSPHGTPFLMLVDHRDSGTGVSTENRANTILSLSDPRSRPEDFVRPGHVNTLIAKDAGVLRRAGHTEAAVDLLKMSGMQPVGCLIEILSPTGHGMATHTELQELAAEFKIPIISIDEIIKHRRLRERLVTREVETRMPTKHGDATLIAYRVEHEDQVPLAIVFGDLNSVPAPLVRMHSSCFTGDVIASLRCDCGDQLNLALEMIGKEQVGALVYLPQEGRGIGLVAKLKAYNLQDQGYDTVEANHKLGFKADQRDYMVGLQILKDLGLTKVRLLTNNPKKTKASVYAGVELEVVEQIPIIAPHEKHRERYMATKRDKMGHILPDEPPALGAVTTTE
ncbi:MAG: cyclohydrolase II/3,4-dihydroxy-2-butanone 4-phosphate synthase [Planctomycetaceae bacterium]|nr:cyclohydrolase II/3,4-dihydroxy-2-butanone 4-phosphate synthase [Planctomycetaceae bacterium]